MAFKPPVLVGIVNLTPDSFSDGGQVRDAPARIRALFEQGAGIVDIGAESTRPGAVPLTPQEEMARLDPLLRRLEESRLDPSRLSLDTRHAQTARCGLRAGFGWINDVSGGADDTLLRAVAEAECRYVLMHSLGVPADPARVLPAQADAVAEVLAWGEARLRDLAARGIARERVAFDPGLGFGKTAAQSLALLRRAERLRELGVEVLIGHSRKSWLAPLQPDIAQRDVETVGASLALAAKGVSYLRVHDVALHARAFAAYGAVA